MSLTKAMWVGVGMALDICVRTFFFEFPFFLAAFSHAPGPVGSTVLKPLRKSGIPADVEIPAPVNPIKCCDSRTHWASWSIFISNSSGVSKYSFFSSSFLWAECAIMKNLVLPEDYNW